MPSPSTLYGDDRYDVKQELRREFMIWTIPKPPEPQAPPAPQLPAEELDTEFKREFPPDPFSHELDETARVWRVYQAHATAHDDTLLDGWNGALDILLIFAGLFSAVTTAFLIESYQRLDFDRDGFVLNALYELVAAQSAGDGVLSLPRPPPVLQTPSPSIRWINGLWFTSLVLALAVSLLSILVKQWLRQYKARNTASAASPRQWAHRRQYLYQALAAYHVADLISILPLLLHMALFVFLAGTVLFLWELDRSIALVVVALGSSLGVFYLVSIGLPLAWPECPTSTPLVNLIRVFCVSAVLEVRHMYYAYCGFLVSLWHAMECPRAFLQRLNLSRAPDIELQNVDSDRRRRRRSEGVSTPPHLPPAGQSLAHGSSDDDIIRSNISCNGESLDGEALIWMMDNISESDALAVAAQAIGGLRPSSKSTALISGDGGVRSKLLPEVIFTRGASSLVECARVAKTWLLIGDSRWSAIRPGVVDGVSSVCDRLFGDYTVPANARYRDLELLGHGLDTSILSVLEHEQFAPAPTSTSTIMVLLHSLRARGLFLLKFCDLFSPEMDWNTVFDVISSHVSPDAWADVPEGRIFQGETAIARTCLGLVALFSNPPSDPNFKYTTLPDVIANLFKQTSLVGRLSRRDSDTAIAARYGPNISNLIEFLASRDFPVDYPNTLDCGLNLLRSAMHLYWRKRDIEKVRFALQAALSMLVRAYGTYDAEAVTFTWSVLVLAEDVRMNFLASDASYSVDFLSLFLLGLDGLDFSHDVVCDELWKHPQSPCFLEAVTTLISWLSHGHANETQEQRVLENSFLHDMPFVAILRHCAHGVYNRTKLQFTNDDYEGDYIRGREEMPCWLLLTLSTEYRKLRPSMWLDDFRSALADPDEYVRALAFVLQRATEEGRQYLSPYSFEQQLRTIRSGE